MIAAAKPKVQLLTELERFLMTMVEPGHPDHALVSEHLNEAGRRMLSVLVPKLRALPSWDPPSVSATLKDTVKSLGVKPPQVMMPFRVALTSRAQTPAIDAIAAALRREVVLGRLERAASA
jgi:glutamyl-tRNA synthetase